MNYIDIPKRIAGREVFGPINMLSVHTDGAPYKFDWVLRWNKTDDSGGFPVRTLIIKNTTFAQYANDVTDLTVTIDGGRTVVGSGETALLPIPPGAQTIVGLNIYPVPDGITSYPEIQFDGYLSCKDYDSVHYPANAVPDVSGFDAAPPDYFLGLSGWRIKSGLESTFDTSRNFVTPNLTALTSDDGGGAFCIAWCINDTQGGTYNPTLFTTGYNLIRRDRIADINAGWADIGIIGWQAPGSLPLARINLTQGTDYLEFDLPVALFDSGQTPFDYANIWRKLSVPCFADVSDASKGYIPSSLNNNGRTANFKEIFLVPSVDFFRGPTYDPLAQFNGSPNTNEPPATANNQAWYARVRGTFPSGTKPLVATPWNAGGPYNFWPRILGTTQNILVDFVFIA